MSSGRKPAASERSIIRWTLFAGFGLIFILWAGSTYDYVSHIADTRSRTNDLHDWYTETEHLLDAVRIGVLEASVDVRDALLDTRAPSDEFYRARLQQTRAAVDRALEQYAPYTDAPAEKIDFADLRGKVADFWTATDAILDLDEAGRIDEALDALRRQIVPRRESIHRMSERIARLNAGAAGDQRRGIETAYASFERRIWLTGGLALLLGVVVALVVTRYSHRMERQIRQEMAKNAESVGALRRLSDQVARAQEDERRAIARELHDEVGQALTAVKMELARARPAGEQDVWLGEARRITDRTLQNVRNLSRLLHPMVLEDLGLPAAIASHLQEFGRRTGIHTEFEQHGMEQRLASGLETAIYRIVQEATSNVARHARASECRVELRRAGEHIALRVEDDGKGFEERGDDAAVPRGLGLVGIRERATGFGGTVVVDSAPGEGTRLVVRLPARSPDDECEARGVAVRSAGGAP